MKQTELAVPAVNKRYKKSPERPLGSRRILALILLGSTLLSCTQDPADRLPQATVFAEPRLLPEFELLDHTGAAFTRESLAGQWSLVFFGFTHCPDICPLTLQKLALARRQIAGDGGVVPEIVFVSVDPARDTSDAVAAYVSAFGEGIRGAVGDIDALNVLTTALGIFHDRPRNADGGYSVEHSAAVVLIDDRARYHALFSAPHDVQSIVTDLALITSNE